MTALLETEDHDVRVTTLTGSVYAFTWDATKREGTLRREPGVEPSSDGGPGSEPMRHDGEQLIVYGFRRLEVGEPALFILEGLGEFPTTVRRVSTVQNIEAV